MVQRVDVQVRSSASHDRVYRLAADGSTWPEWSPVVRCERERAGDASGVGEVRVVHNKGRKALTREEVVELTPNRRVGSSCSRVSRFATTGRSSTSRRTGEARRSAGTRRSSRRRGTGWPYRLVLRAVITRYARGLAEHAGRGD
ncbi:SRPBCC family protein [Saccharothrix isguenensis]